MKKNSKLGWIKITKKSKVQANKFEKVPFAQHFIKKFDRLFYTVAQYAKARSE